MNNKILILITSVFLISSCEDIIQEELEINSITINSPQDNLITTKNQITFWWNEVNSADEYEFQIVEGNFLAVDKFLLDTLLNSNRYLFSFQPGNYTWRVRAKNNISESDYVTRSIQIDSTSNLSLISMNLLNPGKDALLGDENFTFRWDPVFSADSFVLNIREDDAASNEIDTVKLIENQLFYSNNLNDGKYIWSVYAFNATSSTTEEESTFEIDKTAPGKPSLTSPINSSLVVTDTIDLVWSSGTDLAGNWSFDSLYIYQNSSLNIVSYSAKTFGSSIRLPKTEIQTSPSTGTFYWRVKSFDKTGNVSVFSDLESFRFN